VRQLDGRLTIAYQVKPSALLIFGYSGVNKVSTLCFCLHKDNHKQRHQTSLCTSLKVLSPGKFNYMTSEPLSI